MTDCKPIATAHPCEDGDIAFHLTDVEGDMIRVRMSVDDWRVVVMMINHQIRVKEQQEMLCAGNA